MILRKDLDELVCTGRSHMPERLEEKLTVQQTADLFAFIRSMKPTVRELLQPQIRRPELVKAGPDGSLCLRAASAEIRAARVSFDGQQGLPGLACRPPRQTRRPGTSTCPDRAPIRCGLETAQIPQYADNPFVLEALGNRLTGKLPSTGAWRQWERNTYGTLLLSAGRQRIVLRAGGPIRGELSDLREIRLVPAGNTREPATPKTSKSSAFAVAE